MQILLWIHQWSQMKWRKVFLLPPIDFPGCHAHSSFSTKVCWDYEIIFPLVPISKSVFSTIFNFNDDPQRGLHLNRAPFYCLVQRKKQNFYFAGTKKAHRPQQYHPTLSNSWTWDERIPYWRPLNHPSFPVSTIFFSHKHISVLKERRSVFNLWVYNDNFPMMESKKA